MLQDDDETTGQRAALLEAMDGQSEAGRLSQAAAARAWLLGDDHARHWPHMTVPAL